MVKPRTIQTLEDMLRACILDFKGNWGDYVTLIEFSYNNNYHSSIGMAPYEALYGRKCRSPLCWDEVGEKRITGPELVQLTVEKVAIIRQKLKEAQDRQKSWADIKRRSLEFHPGDKVYLRVSPTRGVMRFGEKGKLSSRYIGPFEYLTKYLSDPSHVLEPEPLLLKENLNYEEFPLRIVDRKEQVLRRRSIPYVKVQWSNHTEREATGIRRSYTYAIPELFKSQ
ncbi:UNVERIFIED_CONTAM: hypothetical protein Slati_4220400, partial [Sesamum latifolium]